MHNQQGFWRSVTIFETGLSAAEWGWRIITLLFIGGSGTLTAFMAKADPILKNFGPIYWVAVGIITALFISVIFFLIKAAMLKQVASNYYRVLATPKNSINPLAESFKDLIIHVADLRLPTIQLHENKHFKRCKFVGPAAIAILGGSIIENNFVHCGDIIVLPDSSLTGIIIFKNCTIEQCEFVATTIFVDQTTARAFSIGTPGASIKGMPV